MTFDSGAMLQKRTHQQHAALSCAGAEQPGSASDSSDEGVPCAGAEEKFVRRYHRHAFIDLVVPANSTCVGYVDVSISAVWIAKLCGKVISQQSLRNRDGCRTLSFIDALYAQERGSLVLRVASSGSSVQALCASCDVENGAEVSIQDMWGFVMGCGVCLEQYVVYRSLRDHGYFVFPQLAAHGTLAVMLAVKAGSSTTVLVFSSRDPAETLMRCISLLPGAELRSLTAVLSVPSAADEKAVSSSECELHAAAAAPLVNGFVLAVRSACAAAVVDGTDVTWLGFDLFQ